MVGVDQRDFVRGARLRDLASKERGGHLSKFPVAPRNHRDDETGFTAVPPSHDYVVPHLRLTESLNGEWQQFIRLSFREAPRFRLPANQGLVG